MSLVEIWVAASTAPSTRQGIADAVHVALQSAFETGAQFRLTGLLVELRPN
jgi:hypothetical protein